MTDLNEFQRLLTKHDNAIDRHNSVRKLYHVAFSAECARAYKKKFPRRKFELVKSRDQNQEEHAPIFEKWDALATKLWDNQKARVEKIKEEIEQMAELLTAPVTEELSCFTSNDTYTYNSQGWGASKYAQAASEAALERVKNMGHDGEIRCVNKKNKETGKVYNTVYEVWINTSPLGVALLREKKFDFNLVEWVRSCWKRGVNPRVYNPFLPAEFEENHGLDYFGGKKEL